MSGADIEFAPDLPVVADAAAPAVRFVTFAEFVAHPVPQAEPLVVDTDGNTIIPAAGLTIVYGVGGSGKTTLLLDAACHWATGIPWLDGLATPCRPLRILWVENEGPREEFRRKLERKLAHWGGRIPADHLHTLSDPWAGLDLRDETHRAEIAAMIAEADVDLVIVGPLTRLGMEGGGTPDDVRAFTRLLEDVQERAGRPVSIAVLHHENRAGQISGAWEGAPDLLVHVQAQGNGRTRVFWQKSRWSSTLHGTSAALVWKDAGEGFRVEDKPELTDDAIADAIIDAVREHAGRSWDPIERAVSGGAPRKRELRDRLLADGRLVNLSSKAGRFKLYTADDPVLTAIRPGPDGCGTDFPSATGSGVNPSIRPSVPHKGTDGRTDGISVQADGAGEEDS